MIVSAGRLYVMLATKHLSLATRPTIMIMWKMERISRVNCIDQVGKKKGKKKNRQAVKSLLFTMYAFLMRSCQGNNYVDH